MSLHLQSSGVEFLHLSLKEYTPQSTHDVVRASSSSFFSPLPDALTPPLR
jgi:hypothetical protein